MKRFLSLIIILQITGCVTKNSDSIEIGLTDFKKSIKVILKDSIYLQIVFDSSGHLSSILPYNAGVLDGNAYEFFSNGKLKKRMELKSGRLDGAAEYFHENGNLWKQIHFQRELQQFKKVEYWDGFIPVVKHIFDADSMGMILNVKTFDQKGSFIKDSIPFEKIEIYPE